MAWIESHQSLLRHKKTNRAVALLKVNRYKFIGHLHALWWWALDNAPTGELGDLLPEEIADACGWDVAKGHEFITALITVGFIDEVEDDGLVLHDWQQYAGRYLQITQQRAAAGRKGGETKASNRLAKDGFATKQKDESLVANASNRLAPTNQPDQPKPTNQPDQPSDAIGDVASAFASFGQVSAGTPSAIDWSVKDHGIEWVQLAVRKAASGGATDAVPWSYVESILERWKANGGPDEPRPDNRAPRFKQAGGPAADPMADIERRMQERRPERVPG